MILVCKFRIEAFLLYLNELIFDCKFCILLFELVIFLLLLLILFIQLLLF